MKKRTNDIEKLPNLKNNGTKSPWYKGWKISDEKREYFRKVSSEAREHKTNVLAGNGGKPVHPINTPELYPEDLMPYLAGSGLRCLSLFSGGGGLDVGFERTGYEHVASYEILDEAGQTLRNNRPSWKIFSGDEGDVRKVDWSNYKGKVDVIHAGPPCQPFSTAGRQKGKDDIRDMFPEFIRAVGTIKPAAFVIENVPALGQAKFMPYVNGHILQPLNILGYHIAKFELSSDDFGVPQARKRIFFVGFMNKNSKDAFIVPKQTHDSKYLKAGNSLKNMTLFDLTSRNLEKCMGARKALGLPDIGFDCLAPILRSGLTGPRHTTSILSSRAAMKIWEKLQIWPNGVAPSREAAHKFVPKNNHFRLSVQDCAILQGFPTDWIFNGAVYMAIGQIGNSVAPPVAYQVALAVAKALASNSL